MPRARSRPGAFICGDAVGTVGWREPCGKGLASRLGGTLPSLAAPQQDVVWSGLGGVREGSLLLQLGVGGGERHTGPWAKPWFLEDSVSGSLPCFVSAPGGALDKSPGTFSPGGEKTRRP